MKDVIAKVSKKIKNFLYEQHAEDNGYRTYFVAVIGRGLEPNIYWGTKWAQENLTSFDMRRRAETLWYEMLEMLPKDADGRIEVTTDMDEYHGTVYIKYVQELYKEIVL